MDCTPPRKLGRKVPTQSGEAVQMKRSWSISMSDRITMLNSVICGWINNFFIGAMKCKMEKTDEHLRTMLRKVIWKQWKTPRKRAWGLCKLGIDKRPVQTYLLLWQSLRMGCKENLCSTCNLERGAYAQRPVKLS